VARGFAAPAPFWWIIMQFAPASSLFSPWTEKKVTTIEGLSENGDHPLQKAWQEKNVPQCGYCQGGQILSAVSLLNSHPNPSDEDIDDAMVGNICRCGTYGRIREAIKSVQGGSQ
jgi:aerobic-type carbon monoxide dehydrogenase small subunit (CoxS/CutS family)